MVRLPIRGSDGVVKSVRMRGTVGHEERGVIGQGLGAATGRWGLGLAGP